MKLIMEPNKIDWWFWTVTLACIAAALGGWAPAYGAVALISAGQVLFFWARSRSLLEFDTQVRVVYFAFTLLGLVEAIRFPFFIFLFLGTFMVVAFNRCGIALLLKKMPWNQRQPVNLPGGRP